MEAAMHSAAAGSSTAAIALHSSMVKLFTRRAAAHVELHDLQSAKTDLEQASQPAALHVHTLKITAS